MVDAFFVRLNGRVDVVVGEVQQEGFVSIAFLQKIYGLLGEAFGQIFAFLFSLERGVGPRRVIPARR